MIDAEQSAALGLIRKLERLAPLDAADHAAIGSLPFAIRTVAPGQFLVREGSRSSDCCLLVAGHACRHKVTHDGDRQIVSFHMRGDIVDLCHLQLPTADHNVQAVTKATVACIPAARLREVARARPSIADALWRDALIDASRVREWMLNVGRRDARSRVAHLICEFGLRSEAAGLGTADRFDMPLTQEQIGDATGLTPVHVNRMLRRLGLDGLIGRERQKMRILDWNRLRLIAGFDDSYLHGSAPAAA